jgi:hypothetical protein
VVLAQRDGDLVHGRVAVEDDAVAVADGHRRRPSDGGLRGLALAGLRRRS